MSFIEADYPKPEPLVRWVKGSGGRLISLSSLDAEKKKQIWDALKQNDPARANWLKQLPTDPFFHQLQAQFGAELVMEEGEMKSLLNQKRKMP